MGKGMKRIKAVKASAAPTSEKDGVTVKIKKSKNKLTEENKDRLVSFEEVKTYISFFEVPITKGQILSHFPSLDIATLNEYLNDKSIMDYRGKYLCYETLKVTENDKSILSNILANSFNNDVIHIDTIYNLLLSHNYLSLDNWGIHNAYSLFSLLEILFDGEYCFERPYIVDETTNDLLNNGPSPKAELTNKEEKEKPYENQNAEPHKIQNAEREKAIRFNTVEEGTHNLRFNDLQREYVEEQGINAGLIPCDFSVFESTSTSIQRDSFNYQDENPFLNNLLHSPTKEEWVKMCGFYEIADSTFSTRTMNGLIGTGITTMSVLAEMSPLSVGRIRNVGVKSVRELIVFFNKIKAGDSGLKSIEKEWFVNNKAKIENGDFDSCVVYTDHQKAMLNEISKAYALLGGNTVEQVFSHAEQWALIAGALNDYNSRSLMSSRLEKKINELPPYRKKNHLINYFSWYEQLTQNEVLFNTLSSSALLLENIKTVFQSIEADVIESLLEELKTPLLHDFKGFIDSHFSSKVLEIYQLRSQGITLDELGRKRNLTRERIRQIEKRGQRMINSWFRNNAVLSLLYADLDGSEIVSQKLLKERTAADDLLVAMFWHALYQFLKEADSTKLNGNYIILGEIDIKQIYSLIDSFPSVFNEEYLNKTIQQNKGLESFIKDQMENGYYYNNGVYSKKNLTNGDKFEYILKNYYPSGIRVYDERAIDEFVDRVKTYFPYNYTSRRAVENIIAKVGVLCDRGKYVAAGNRLPKELIKKINNWILEQGRSAVLIQSILLAFEDDLNPLGINNKYQLQGVLKQETLRGVTIRRDYAFNKKNADTIYNTVSNYICSFDYPVSKQQIKDAFPGITDIVIAYALEDTSIINLFGEYIDADKLNLSKEDLAYFEEKLDESLAEGKTVHIAELYESIKKDNESLLKKLGLYRSFGLFSLLQYKLPESAEYDRPFIAAPGKSIIPSSKQIGRFVQEHPMLLVEDLLWKAKALHFSIQDIRLFLEGFFDTHVLLNKGTMVSIDLLELQKETYLQLEEEIIRGKKVFSIETFKSEKNKSYLEDADQWLMYSLVKKWGEKLTTNIIGKTFAEAVPSVSIKSSGEVVKWNGWVDLDNPETLQRLYEEMLALEMESGNEFFEL